MAMRLRSRGEYSPHNCECSQQNGDCSQVSWTNTIPGANGFKEDMWDVVTKDFAKRIANGETIVNPMFKTTNTRTFDGTSAKYYSANTPCNNWIEHGNGYRVYQALGFVTHLDTTIDSGRLAILAGTAARANVRAPEFDGATFFAELRETISMLRRPVLAWERAIKAIQANLRKTKGSEHGSRILLDLIEQQWLQYRYGIMPLVYSAEDAMKALESMRHRRVYFTARGRSSEQTTASATESNNVNSWSWRIDREVETVHTVNVRAGIRYYSDRDPTWGLDWENVPPAAWEVVPFSFVADWFVNIGDYLRAITPKLGVKVVGSWTTTVNTRSTTGTSTSEWIGTNPNTWSTEDPTALETHITEQKKRSRGTHMGLSFKPWTTNESLGRKRILDAIALTDQILGKPLGLYERR